MPIYCSTFKDVEVYEGERVIGHNRIVVLEVLDGYPTEDLVLSRFEFNFHDRLLYIGLELHLIRSKRV